MILPRSKYVLRIWHKLFILGLILFTSAAIGACTQQSADESMSSVEAGMDMADAEEQFQSPRGAESSPPPGSPDLGQSIVERKLLRTAKLSLLVENADSAAGQLAPILVDLGAYIASERTFGEQNKDLEYSLRVPAENFDSLLVRVSALAIELEFRSVEVVDVTRQYIDIASRLATQRALAERLQELLKRATKVSDVLEIEREFSRVIADIESAEAQLKSINLDSRYARVELTLHSKKAALDRTGPSFFRRVGESFAVGFHGLEGLALVLIAIWPLWIVGLVLGWWFWRRRGRK